MAEKKGAPAARREIDPLVFAGEIKKELLRARQFGSTWGELCKGQVAASLEETIELKRAELARLEGGGAARGKSAAQLVFATTTGTLDESTEKPDPEAGLMKGFKVLRAGV